VLVVFSDGVTDAMNPQGNEFGEARLAEVVSEHRGESSAEILDAVNHAITNWTAGTPLPDDLTLLVARRTG
jgi:sigma-B regulation protein RsbU (phosphoserine phosphatase)